LGLLRRTVQSMRRERELSQEAVAFASDLHPNQVGRLERGDANVCTKTFLRIVDGLGVPLSEVVALYEARVERAERA
jgi:transcriptional regulator with XRE-family HTH domain